MEEMEDLMEPDPLVARTRSHGSTSSTRSRSVGPLHLSEHRANFSDDAISFIGGHLEHRQVRRYGGKPRELPEKDSTGEYYEYPCGARSARCSSFDPPLEPPQQLLQHPRPLFQPAPSRPADALPPTCMRCHRSSLFTLIRIKGFRREERCMRREDHIRESAVVHKIYHRIRYHLSDSYDQAKHQDCAEAYAMRPRIAFHVNRPQADESKESN